MQWDESSGFLWIATEAGLSRFNGIDFVNFTRANTSFISSERIRFMVRNKNNQIRAADMDGNVFSISENRPTLLYDHNKLSKNLAKDCAITPPYKLCCNFDKPTGYCCWYEFERKES